MAFQARVFFEGLCGFVPNKRLDDHPTRMTVLLVNAEDPGKVPIPYPKPDPPDVVFPHQAGLLFKMNNLISISGREVDVRFRVRGQDEMGLFLINGWDVSLDFGAITKKITFSDGRHPNYNVPRNACEEKDFSWIAEMPKVQPLATVDPSCMMASGAELERRVAARVFVEDGELSTYRVARRAAGGARVRWEFDDLDNPGVPSDYTQALASVGMLTKEACHLRIVARRFGYDDPVQILELGPTREEREETVEPLVDLFVVNLEWEQIIDPEQPLTAIPPTQTQAVEFRWLYKLSVIEGAKKPMPVPSDSNPAGGRSVYCPFGVFAHYEG